MSKYEVVDKPAFTVVGIGTALKSDYMDQASLNKEKETYFSQTHEDGTVEKLKKIAKNDFLFVVNEAVDNEMMHYVGVESDQKYAEATRMIQFPEGAYIVVAAEADLVYALTEKLTGIAFGEVLYTVADYAYVGGPNAAVIQEEKDGIFSGEMWIPVVKQ